MDNYDIFDSAARKRQVTHASSCQSADRWLISTFAKELISRLLEDVQINAPILIVGHHPAEMDVELSQPFVHASIARWDESTIICEEDALPFGPNTFGSVLAIGTMDSVNDLPGALIQIRRCLKPGGRFLGAFAGVGSGQFLRQMTRTTDPTVARAHPQIDVRAAGDLLARAGFLQPVADADEIKVRYSSLSRLLHDVRCNGLGNCLSQRSPLTRKKLADWQAQFNQARDEGGKVTETVCPVYMSGISPEPR